jgi:protein-tyrosine phosphatase
VVEGKLAVGNFGAASDPEFIRRHGFRSVLGLTRTLFGKKAAELGLDALEVVPLVDGPGNDLRTFTRAVETLRDFAEHHPPVLVHCHAGRSRSVVVTAAYLKGVHGLESEEALRLVTQKREASVTPALMSLLDHYYAS